MCGIIGAFGKTPNPKTIEQARDLMAHRGPNASGVFYDKPNEIALGFRRLSIIDLSEAGNQPFWSNDRRYVLVFNGELYNYLELRDELANDYDFKTQTDTEVLLAAYIKWGEECLQKFNGMFAFAIWDRQKKELFCARDRLGIKPFYYFVDGPAFCFASEIKALFPLGSQRAPNEKAIFDYLFHGLYDHTEETFFEGIKTLRGGHFMILREGKVVAKRKYWDPSRTPVDYSQWFPKQVANRFRELVSDSLKLQFRSDVPVGIYLSSGLDSNILNHMAQKLIKHDFSLFSACSPTKDYNECELIDEYLSAGQKRRWYRSNLNLDNFFELAQSMNPTQDQPYGGLPTIGMGELNKLAKDKGVVVLLHGQGVDELFGGYRYYRQEHDRDLRREPSAVEAKSGNSAARFSQDATILIHPEVLDAEFIKKWEKHELIFERPFDSHLQNAQYRDIVYTKIPRALRFSDHLSMAHSRELRVPYLDHRLVEFALHLPAKYKINEKDQKVLPRMAMQGILPEQVNSRPKKSFGAMQIELFRASLRDGILEFLNSGSFRKRPYWNHEALIEKVHGFLAGHLDNSFFIWQCINLELWMKTYVD